MIRRRVLEKLKRLTVLGTILPDWFRTNIRREPISLTTKTLQQPEFSENNPALIEAAEGRFAERQKKSQTAGRRAVLMARQSSRGLTKAAGEYGAGTACPT
jgi:hypothetical protein